MNAGAYNYTVSDNVISVECISEEGEVIILKKNKCNFDYRSSIFKNTKIIIV